MTEPETKEQRVKVGQVYEFDCDGETFRRFIIAVKGKWIYYISTLTPEDKGWWRWNTEMDDWFEYNRLVTREGSES